MKAEDISVIVKNSKYNLETQGTATVHWIKNNPTPNDCYVEVGISVLPKHIVDSPDDLPHGYVKSTLSTLLDSVKTVYSDKTVQEIQTLIQEDIIPTEYVYKELETDKWILFSDNKICVILLSKNWKSVSDYYNTPIGPTLH